MDRREFTLQLYDGRSKPTPIVPVQVAPTQDSAQVAETSPTWRCSGCLMAWGVYGPTTSKGRPEGDGCLWCSRNGAGCKPATWVAESPGARKIDDLAFIDSRGRLAHLHDAAPLVIASVEHVILRGQYHRLTPSAQDPISDKVRTAVEFTMMRWMREHRAMTDLQPITIEFHTGYLHTAKIAAMSVGVRLTQPTWKGGEKFTVRYRWVQ